MPTKPLIVLFLICFLAAPVSAQDAEPAPESKETLQAGQWRHRFPKTPTGRGSDAVIKLAQTNGQWQITLINEHYPGDNKANRRPSMTKEGPYLVTAEGGVISWETEEK